MDAEHALAVSAYVRSHPEEAAPSWARRAAVAHAVYSPEVRHPVEVAAQEEKHLVAWLSRRMGATLKIPHLDSLGFSLVGAAYSQMIEGPWHSSCTRMPAASA